MSHWRPSIRLQAPSWHGILPDTFKTAKPPSASGLPFSQQTWGLEFRCGSAPCSFWMPRAELTHYRQSIHKPVYKWKSDGDWGLLLQCLQTLTLFHRRWNTFCLFCQYSSWDSWISLSILTFFGHVETSAFPTGNQNREWASQVA